MTFLYHSYNTAACNIVVPFFKTANCEKRVQSSRLVCFSTDKCNKRTKSIYYIGCFNWYLSLKYKCTKKIIKIQFTLNNLKKPWSNLWKKKIAQELLKDSLNNNPEEYVLQLLKILYNYTRKYSMTIHNEFTISKTCTNNKFKM